MVFGRDKNSRSLRMAVRPNGLRSYGFGIPLSRLLAVFFVIASIVDIGLWFLYLFIPRPPNSPDAAVELPVGVAGFVLAWFFYRKKWYLQGWLIHFAAFSAIALVSLALVAAHGGPSLLAMVFYLWIDVALFHYLKRSVAIGYLLLMDLAMALVLIGVHAGSNGPAQWVVMASSAAVIGWFVSEVTERLHRQAITDPLTGLPNRQALEKILPINIAHALRYEESLTLAIIDLDDFKEVNDNDGHQAGDEVLKRAANSWRRTLRSGDLLFRWGGDEFLVVFPKTGVQESLVVANRLLEVGCVKCSIGLARLTSEDNVASLLARADQALYQAKQAGKKTIRHC